MRKETVALYCKVISKHLPARAEEYHEKIHSERLAFGQRPPESKQ
jgi:hypothetical protein